MPKRLIRGESKAYERLAATLTRGVIWDLQAASRDIEREWAVVVVAALDAHNVAPCGSIVTDTVDAAFWKVVGRGPHAYVAWTELPHDVMVYGWLTEGTEEALQRWVTSLEDETPVNA